MAQVTHETQLQARISRYLDYLMAEWRAIPALAAEWGQWEDFEQLDFVIEWPIREDRLHQLEQWAAQGLFTPAQRDRYDELLGLVERNRPILDALLAE